MAIFWPIRMLVNSDISYFICFKFKGAIELGPICTAIELGGINKTFLWYSYL